MRNSVTGAAQHEARHGPGQQLFPAHSGAHHRIRLGESWCRPGIDPKTRSMLNIAMVALNRSHEHSRAIDTGVTEQGIQAILLQTLIYCGAPAALESS